MKKKGLLMVLVTAIVVFTATYVAFGNVGASAPGSSDDPIVSKSYVDARSSYKAVQLMAGQQLIGGEGTEIIVRSGEATAIDNGANGISDVTSGTDLMTGMQVGLNHLLLVPKNDGRGIAVSTEAWVMVRGDYTIK